MQPLCGSALSRRRETAHPGYDRPTSITMRQAAVYGVMIRATKVIRAGHWSGVATDAVVLGFDDRHRRRLAMRGERGAGVPA